MPLCAHRHLACVISQGKPIPAGRGAYGQPAGVSIDLAHELAEQLGVPLALEVFEATGKSVQAVTRRRSASMVANLDQPASMDHPPFFCMARERGVESLPCSS